MDRLTTPTQPSTPPPDDLAAGGLHDLQQLLAHPEFGLGVGLLADLRDRLDRLIDDGGTIHLGDREAFALAAAADLGLGLLDRLGAGRGDEGAAS
jgi:hypothetical protein